MSEQNRSPDTIDEMRVCVTGFEQLDGPEELDIL